MPSGFEMLQWYIHFLIHKTERALPIRLLLRINGSQTIKTWATHFSNAELQQLLVDLKVSNWRSLGPALDLKQPPSWGRAPDHLGAAPVWPKLWWGNISSPILGSHLTPGCSVSHTHSHTHPLSSHSLVWIFASYFLVLSSLLKFLFEGWWSQRVKHLPLPPPLGVVLVYV